MGTTGESLAAKFEQANGDFFAFVGGLTDEQWKRTSQAEGWSVGVTAHHVAESTMGVARWVEAVANKASFPPFDVDVVNAEHASRAVGVTKAETLALIRENGAAAASMLRGLSDEQLAQTTFLQFVNGDVPASGLAEMVLIGHIGMHLGGIKAATS